jgi:hypothetical protein
VQGDECHELYDRVVEMKKGRPPSRYPTRAADFVDACHNLSEDRIRCALAATTLEGVERCGE